MNTRPPKQYDRLWLARDNDGCLFLFRSKPEYSALKGGFFPKPEFDKVQRLAKDFLPLTDVNKDNSPVELIIHYSKS